MNKLKFFINITLLFTLIAGQVNAQGLNDMLGGSGFGNSSSGGSKKSSKEGARDTTKEIPRGLYTWTLNPVGGDRTFVVPDTTWYMRMNHVFAEGVQGEYNTTGNNGSPRQNRIFMNRKEDGKFIFTNPYSQFIVQPEDFHFTNTYSPITNLTYHSCGDKLDGEDWFKALYAVNVNKKIGFGFKLDYLYARGYYQNQSTSHFNFSTWGSYIGDRYQAHLLVSLNHQKVKENGGLQDDELILHPQSFEQNYATTEMPVHLSAAFNKNDNQHILFNHRYNIGFSRKVPMTEKEIEAKKFAMQAEKDRLAREAQNKDNEDNDIEESDNLSRRRSKSSKKDEKAAPTGRPTGAIIAGDEPAKDKPQADSTRISMTDIAARDSIAADEARKKAEEEANMFMKDEYVPVTSFFHTLDFNHYARTFISQQNSLNGYFANDYYTAASDSISDFTRHVSIHNTAGIALLEGFNKYVKAGLKAFARHELEFFTLPLTDDKVNVYNKTYNEHNLFVGGLLSKREGKVLHFNAMGEVCVVGENIGNLNINGGIDLNFKLFGDTLHLDADAFYKLQTPTFYYRRYASRHFQWDNDLSKISHTHIGGSVSWEKTNTKLSVGVDNIGNYTYFAMTNALTTEKQTETDVFVRQAPSNIQVITAQLQQNLAYKILHWDNVITFQHTSDEYRLPLPTVNIYSALYLRLKIAKVLDCDLGADVRYFTKYYAPEYSVALSQFAVQENENIRVKLGNYPYINVFANLQLKNCRFYIMMSHINCSAGNYFLTPHYPVNPRVLRLGLSWNFFN